MKEITFVCSVVVTSSFSVLHFTSPREHTDGGLELVVW